jgi:signal transduction histidine kinase
MTLSYQGRLVAAFGGLTAVAMGALLFLMGRWTDARLEEEIGFRLASSARVLRQLHEASARERLRRFASLAVEPRFRALAEAGDEATLRHAATEIRRELDCAALGFLDAQGRPLAWDGTGAEAVAMGLQAALAADQAEPTTHTLRVGDAAMEVALVPLRAAEERKGYLVALVPLDTGVLAAYAVGTGGRIEVRDGERPLATSGAAATGATERTAVVPLPRPLVLAVHLDVSTLAAGLHEARRALWMLALACVVSAGVLSWFVAGRIARPMRELARAAQAVGTGDLTVRAAARGAPEVVELARQFNAMVDALARSRDALRAHAENLEQMVRARTHEADEARARAEANLAHAQAMQAQVVAQHEKLAALGLLAAGVTHEINNPMAFVYGNLQLLQEAVPRITDALQALARLLDAARHGPVPVALLAEVAALRDARRLDALGEDLPDAVRESVEGAERVIRIVRDMRTHVHAGAEHMEVADLREAMESTLTLVRGELGGRVAVHREYGDVPPVRCYPQQLRQVFLNLVVNAAQAIDGPEGAITVRSRTHDGTVVWEVADTGAGMSEEVRRNLFQPFFTTKGVGKGTGLGLYTVRQIVERHGGRIEVDSVPGVGATFRVILPLDRPAGGAQ